MNNPLNTNGEPESWFDRHHRAIIYTICLLVLVVLALLIWNFHHW